MPPSEQPAEWQSIVKVNTEATMVASGPSKAQNEATSEPTADEIEALRTLHAEAEISTSLVTRKKEKVRARGVLEPQSKPVTVEVSEMEDTEAQNFTLGNGSYKIMLAFMFRIT